ncbi:hypothetical protein G5C51_15845 [Streptomyces sp. A7024]|uniref:Neocarzinostatin family protein n=1 Tax=Streptomyces coryli TaxID=1128680 RepID=A0A6G4TZV8_9ACTN|nr:hypothetical protein [Streptomyces coryli]
MRAVRYRVRDLRRSATAAVVAVLALVLIPVAPLATAAPAADKKPEITLSDSQSGAGGNVTVTGKDWPAKALLTLLICGQNMIGGTDSCANADGRAVTTDAAGTFSRKLRVAEPPKPCPCVVAVATVTGRKVAAQKKFVIAGHATAPLPPEAGRGRLALLGEPGLEGTSGILNWFGAPAQRRLTVTVGNMGTEPAKNPVFEIGTAHGVVSPEWERRQWRGVIPPGGKKQVKLLVELPSGAHGDYVVSMKYQGRLLAEQPWGVARPWGVMLFWVLLFVVVVTAAFRIGMTIVGRLRPYAPDGRHRAKSSRRRWQQRERPNRTPEEGEAPAGV